MSDYNIKIEYIARKNNQLADRISRLLTVSSKSEVKREDLIRQQISQLKHELNDDDTG